MKYRFSGIKRLYGATKFEKISSASVCVIGIGGVGSWAIEALARSAFMNITMIDLDDICITNTNRQLHALSSTIGRSKIEVMKTRVQEISPDCNVTCNESFITSKNLEDYNFDNFDYIIDAIDSIRPKVALIDYCIKKQLNLVTIGAGAGKTDPTKILIDDLYDSKNDKLLKRVKKILRKEYNYTIENKSFGVDSVFSYQRAVYPGEDGEVCFRASGENTKLDCESGMGTATAITGALGFAAVSRVLEKI